jgi:hypothetical protein
MGIKMPLINIIGKRTKLESIIILEGLSVGGLESRTPKLEKQKLEKRIFNTRIARLLIVNPKTRRAKRRGTKEIIMPKRKPARISPKKIN